MYTINRPFIQPLPACDAVNSGVLGTYADTSHFIVKIVKGFGIACLVLTCIALILGLLIVLKRFDLESSLSKPFWLIFLCILTVVIAIIVIIMGSILISTYSNNNMSNNISSYSSIVTSNCLES